MRLVTRPIWFGLVLLLGLGNLALRAATIVPPENLGALARRADAVVLAIPSGATGVIRGGLIFTRTQFLVEQSLSGPLGRLETFEVDAPGGSWDGTSWSVPGSPRFTPGREYLLFLSQREDRPWILTMLSYGVLESFTGDGGIELLVPIESSSQLGLETPDGSETEPLQPFVKATLLEHLAQVLWDGTPWSSSAAGAAPELVPERGAGGVQPGACAFLTDGGVRFRWRAFDTNGTATIHATEAGDPSLAGGPFRLIQEALDAWMQIPGTSFNLLFGGTVATRSDCSSADSGILKDTIVLNDPCNDIEDLDACSGILAFGGPLDDNGSHRFDGATWRTATGWIMVVNNGSGCLGADNYRLMLSHELGHGLGFGHVEDSNALMFRSCCHGVNATDRACAFYTYPGKGAGNTRPRVQAGDDITLALLGDSVRVGGTVTDDGLPAAPGRVSTEWSKLSGPGDARFLDSKVLATTVTFTRSGEYVLGLRATDGELIHANTLVAAVDIRSGQVARVTFQQRVNGYSGTVDTGLTESAPSTDHSKDTALSSDADDPASSGQENQILLRFDSIFGSKAAQVPPGATISSASLDVTVVNSGAGARMHRMKHAWSDSDTWSSLGGTGVRTGVDAETAADAQSVGTVTPERIDVVSSLRAWARDPCSSFGWAFLPRGTDGWDFESSEGASPPLLTVEYETGGEALVPADAAWSYWKGLQAPPADWNGVDFVPGAGWLEGRGGIGYGDGDDAIELSDMRGQYLTVFVRTEFEATAEQVGRGAILTIVCDDGAVAYVNGVEVGRENMPAGAAGANTPASSTVEARARSFRVPAARLQVGRNVLAASGHNFDLGSSDFSFSALLSSLPEAGSVTCDLTFVRGDFNQDGTLNLTDAVGVLGFLFRGGAAPACLDSGDADDDGRLQLTDAVLILSRLFRGGVVLPPPSEACGLDPTPDPLGECAAPACGS